MRVIEISEANKSIYFHCLERHSDEMTEAVTAKEKWYDKMKGKGLRVKMAEDETGDIGGMIQYFPIEESWIEGRDLYFVSCIWVHSNKDGKKNFQGKGMGKALLRAAEEDVKGLGKKGLVVWGTSLPVWMKASWYKKQGYQPVDKKGLFGDVLLWKTFSDDAAPPRWVRASKKQETSGDKVRVTCMASGWCSAMNLSCQRVREVAGEYGDHVEVEEVSASDPSVFREWGSSDLVFIDGKKVGMGPPPSRESIRKVLDKKIRKKGLA